MGNPSENKEMNQSKKQICVGILAHVDAGKTTLAESMLYQCGSIRKVGRVDHGDAFLDTFELERARGITIFSKQAQLKLGDIQVTLLDTPGHVDFSAEMERTLQVLDYAVLVISGADGVQGHVQTLWRLLRSYQVPVFLFINKMDQPGTDQEALLAQLKARLDERCVCFDPNQDQASWLEELAVCEETLLEQYLEQGEISREQIISLIADRKVFPCFFGSALKMEGITEFLQGLQIYTKIPSYPDAFGARVYKIARDEQGNRLTYLKVTGGKLQVKMPLTNQSASADGAQRLKEPVFSQDEAALAGAEGNSGEIWEEKVNQIRIYSGADYQAVSEAGPGSICAVTGLSKTYAGEGLGIESASKRPLLEPVLTYEIRLPEGCDTHKMLLKLRQLEEEEPMLHIVWQEQTGEIHAQVMGQVQMEILKVQIQERFGVEVEFGTGTIVYKETILEPVEGVGHFEPLRHYAEVHLLLEPGEAGSGLQFDTLCSEDQLDRNWQRLILTHLAEKQHRGVLTGSEITDMKITLVAGRAHVKHTEGGDFRQATYRAVRQGLCSTKNVLLEPVYAFRLEVPGDKIGRAMADMQRMYGSFEPPVQEGEMAVLTGSVPVAALGEYAREVAAYTRGSGRISCTLKGYEPCHNEEEVIAAYAYDPEADLSNPAGSVFCAHGAGFVVPWDQVRDYMHLEGYDKSGQESKARKTEVPSLPAKERRMAGGCSSQQEEKELQAIFERTYGPVRRERSNPGTVYVGKSPSGERYSAERSGKKKPEGEDYLLVDGYNIIFAWEELKELAQINLEAARSKLMDLLCDYQGFRKNVLILVFDAYKVPGNPGSISAYHNIYVVYTKEAETADQYIEKTVHEIGRKHSVTVATSDALEQVIILGQGARRMSAKGLRKELEAASIEIREVLEEKRENGKHTLFDHLPEGLSRHMEQVRLGKKDFGEK